MTTMHTLTDWWRRWRQPRATPSFSLPIVTDETAWEVRMNGVRAGSILEQTIRRIERELQADKRMKARMLLRPIGELFGVLARILVLWFLVAAACGGLVITFACWVFPVQTTQWLASASPVEIGSALHGIGAFIAIVTLLSTAFQFVFVESSRREPAPEDHIEWGEQVRLAAQIAPLGHLELRHDDASNRRVLRRAPRGRVYVALSFNVGSNSKG